MDADERREIIDGVFEGELTAEELRDLRRALGRRLMALKRAHQRGEVTAEQVAELEGAAEKLNVLAEEESISQFVEDGLRATLRRRELLDALGEADGPGFD